MKPIEPSPDGTPPLPFLTHSPSPAADLFEADPFFNPPAPLPAVSDERPSDELPADPAPPVASVADPTTTAEERLLETIVSLPNHTDAPRAQILAKELSTIKIRCAALETELTGARSALKQAQQARTETETRFELAEKQWTGKLSQLRHMLDEVEDARDDVFQKRVPKLLFIGTVIAGIVATIFAYLIGAGQSTPPPPAALPEPPPALAAGIPAPSAAEKAAAPLEPSRPTPPPAPVLMPELTANPPAPSLKPPVSETPPPKPIDRAPRKTAAWPVLSGSRWNTVSSAKELKVVFHYGTFSRGTELSSTARQDLSRIAATLKDQPFMIEVEGHTDATRVPKAKGNGKNNQALGLARANVVARYLIDSCGLPAATVTTSSAGETQPPYPNTSEANQQKNRTVILKISAH